MKVVLLSLSLLSAFLATSRALDIVTPDGTLKDVVVKKVVGEAVSVMHSEGTALVDFDLLPPALQAEYGWTPEKSAARKAAKEAEAKRIADEEKEIAEAPKRKAMEAAAKKKAEADALAEEETARRKIANAAFEAESATAQSDLIAAAAKAREELDRERKGGKGKADEVPVATVIDDTARENAEAPGPRKNAITPPFGTVSDVLGGGNSIFQNYKVWIGVIIGFVVVVILFMLPSSAPKKVRRR